MSKIEPGCWIKTRHGNAVAIKCKEVEGKTLVIYRYAAVPFRNNVPMIKEQRWVFYCEGLNHVEFLYPRNVVSDEVLRCHNAGLLTYNVPVDNDIN
jgi:hypothetical protein